MTETRSDSLRRTYAAADAADRAFHAALEAEYGKRAGGMRYQSLKHPPHIRRLAEVFQEASAAHIANMRNAPEV